MAKPASSMPAFGTGYPYLTMPILSAFQVANLAQS